MIKLTTQAVRKVLNNAGLENKGYKKEAVISGRLICGYRKVVTGMTIRIIDRDANKNITQIEVFANTNHPYDDIKKACTALEEAGYKVRQFGFSCWVEL